MTGIEVLAQHRQEIEALCLKYGVQRLLVFGSTVRDDWDAGKSDFDFLAEFGPPPPGVNLFRQQFGLIADLEAVLGRHVDVVDWNAMRKPIFRRLAEAEAQEFYAA